MFGFFKNKSALLFDQDLVVDIHNHILPGIDDGSQAMEDTLKMASKFSSMGYKKLIATPHVYWDYYKNTPEIIQSKLEEVKQAFIDNNLDLKIEAAAEYYFDSYFLDLIQKKELLTFGDNYILFELPFSVKPNNVDQLIFSLIGQGYKPILAHYERYLYYHSPTLSYAIDFRRRGVLIQMNLLSLTGYYGIEVKKQAELMIDKGIVDIVSTDCHNIKQLQRIQQYSSKKYFKKLKELQLLNKTF